MRVFVNSISKMDGKNVTRTFTIYIEINKKKRKKEGRGEKKGDGIDHVLTIISPRLISFSQVIPYRDQSHKLRCSFNTIIYEPSCCRFHVCRMQETGVTTAGEFPGRHLAKKLESGGDLEKSLMQERERHEIWRKKDGREKLRKGLVR